MSKARKILSGIVIGLLVVMLLFNLLGMVTGAVTGQKNAPVLGLSSAVVLTGSMSGVIEPGDVVVTWHQDSYQVGDIIMYQGNTSTVTHRVISVEEAGYLTKGDANNIDDRVPIPPEQVVGKVILTVPGAGNVILFFRTPLGLLILTAVLLLLLYLSAPRSRKLPEKGETDGQAGEAPPH